MSQGERLVRDPIDDERHAGRAKALAGEDEGFRVGDDLDELELHADANAASDRLERDNQGGEGVRLDTRDREVEVERRCTEMTGEEPAPG